MQEGATSSLVPNVLTGQLNAAIVHLPVDDPELVIEPLFAEDLLLLAADGHPLADRDTIPLADLDEVPLLLPPPGAALRRVLDRAAATADITLRGSGRGRRCPPPGIVGVRRLRRRDRAGHRRADAGSRDRSTASRCRNSPDGSLPSRDGADPAQLPRRWRHSRRFVRWPREQGKTQHGVHPEAAAIPFTRPG